MGYRKLKEDELVWLCPDEYLPFKTTREITPKIEIIGQPRGMVALKTGIDIEGTGYNIFVTGEPGTGRKTTIRKISESSERIKKVPPDKCFVFNFKNEDAPLLIELPPGKGKKLKKEMEEIVDLLILNVNKLLKSETYKERREKIIKKYQSIKREEYKKFQEKILDLGFTIVSTETPEGIAKPEIAPLFDGKPINFTELYELVSQGKISKEEVAEKEANFQQLTEELEDMLKRWNQLDTEARKEIRELNKDVILSLFQEKIEELKKELNSDKVSRYLDDVKESLIEDIPRFAEAGERIEAGGKLEDFRKKFIEYKVNLIVDNSQLKTAPVIFEHYPSYRNLFGTIEREMVQGQWRTDFTKIKAGSFIKADGGILVIDIYDLATEPGAWQGLKRALKSGMVEISAYDPLYPFATVSLKPEPIKCNVKVILLGDNEMYHLLYESDPDFSKIFKIKAEFDSEMNLSQSAVRQYVHFIKGLVEKEKLKDLEKDAVKRIIEEAVRMSDSGDKITTKFGSIADIIRESQFYAEKENSEFIRYVHVKLALKNRDYRLNLIEEKIHELIKRDIFLISTEGKAVGQINGLAVYEIGGYRFGRPSRITARVSMGNKGIINIEKETGLGGKIHNKGVLILSGYLFGKYGREFPVNLNATLCFEQSYSGVDGDSASSAELCVLLSAIGNIPLSQEIAITGSVNQMGEIQPIGGVNEKIKGFFKVCKEKGFTGNQGVIIPERNVKDLSLPAEIREAVKENKFHIYSVTNIEDAMEILSGLKWQEIEERVKSALKDFSERLKEWEA